MCGILVHAGTDRPFWHGDLELLRARGPDSVGFWSDGAVNVGSTRLAVLGLDPRGTGPLVNQTHVLAYNGEIYNFDAIRRRLEATGVDLRDANDAEVLLAAWSTWGEDVLPQLKGFWAFVVYDRQRGRLTLVRDQLGIKPLYYQVRGREVRVSSLISGILATLPSKPTLDYEALSEYAAFQLTFGDKTFVSGLKKVLPGHIVEIDVASGDSSSRCYEDIFAPAGAMDATVTDDWLDEARELLWRCVRESTVSDTPFTTTCSGGIDSSLVTRIAQPEIAFHCNFSDPDCNETFFARQVVEGTPIRLFVVNAEEDFNLVTRLQSLVKDFDELTVGSVILPLDDLLRQVSRRYKVFLNGTGGDELFGGYVRYQIALGECFQDSYRGLFESLRDVTNVSDRFLACHRKGDTKAFRFFDAGVDATFRKAFEESRLASNDLHAMLTFDRRYFLPALLNIDDKIAGRHSLEGRPSLLHQDFVRHVNTLEPSELLRGPNLKWVLRSLASNLPASVVQRQDKMGFTTPIGTFVQRSSDHIREQLFRSPFRDLYDLSTLNLASQGKFSREVFGILMMDLWLNHYAA